MTTKAKELDNRKDGDRSACSICVPQRGVPTLYERLGYFHPPNLPDEWLVKELCGQAWDRSATVDLRGTW